MPDAIPSIEELEREVQLHKSRLDAAMTLLAAARAYAAVRADVPAAKLNAQAAKVPMQPRKRFRLISGMQQTEEAAAHLMESLKRPVQTGEIIKRQEELGHMLPENASNVVSARMSNSTKFEGRRGQGWWFSDRPWPGDFIENVESD
ncbi:MAG TPA: hypothetical protein VL094_13695 [Sphingomonadaceae bacterium]|nr:hypothetical protein [Sphingomonadaceae bacterium]